MILCGIDLAWQSEKNPSAIAWGMLDNNSLVLGHVEPVIYGIEAVLDVLSRIESLRGVAIDAPLIINNAYGQRDCEREIGRQYGSRRASCHASNTSLYPDAKSVYLSSQLLARGFNHLTGRQWQLECYPHPSLIEIFALQERLKYKKGKVADKRAGQIQLASLIGALTKSQVLSLICDENVQHLDKLYIQSLKGRALKSNEDALDSIICLYIAGLYCIQSSGYTFGTIRSGYIWVPNQPCI